MPVTRHQARSSFTFEIKRANRRTPEVLTLSNAAASLSLADQVFGKPLAGPTARTARTIESLRSELTLLSDIDQTTSQPNPVRRILPDLLTILIDPVEERATGEEQEKA